MLSQGRLSSVGCFDLVICMFWPLTFMKQIGTCSSLLQHDNQNQASACAVVFVCVSDLNPRQKKGAIAVIMCCPPPPSSYPTSSCHGKTGDPRCLKLILACDSLKASATLMRTRVPCPHSIHLLENQCPNLFPAPEHLKQSEGVSEKTPPPPPVALLLLLLLLTAPPAARFLYKQDGRFNELLAS